MNVQAVDELICAALRGENLSSLGGSSRAFAETFRERSQFHGVQVLLNERLYRAQGWPPAVMRALHCEARSRAMWELRHQYVLARTLDALVKVGVRPVLLKGTALAYSVYTNPALRTRGDTDFIIQPHERSRLHEALLALGFKAEMEARTEFVSHQTNYTLETEGNGTHTLDVHWKISNRSLLSKLFSYEELRSRSVLLPNLCPNARGAGPAHALLLACMHRAGHKQSAYFVNGVAHYSGDRLIWLYDIHLLAGALALGQWQEFLELATEKGLCATCLEGMERARGRFRTTYPEFVQIGLAQANECERASNYLNASRLRQHWLDVSAIEGLSNRIRFIRELVFPPSEYMHNIYPQAKLSWLPWLYLRRGWRSLISRRLGILKTK